MDNKLDAKLDALDAQIALMREKVEQLKAEAIKLAQATGCERRLLLSIKKAPSVMTALMNRKTLNGRKYKSKYNNDEKQFFKHEFLDGATYVSRRCIFDFRRNNATRRGLADGRGRLCGRCAGGVQKR